MQRSTYQRPAPSNLASMIAYGGELPHPSDPLGRQVREYFANNWREARERLLDRTQVIEVEPLPPEGPRSFSFVIHRPYRKRHPSGEVTLEPGPVEGTICYHANVLRPPRDAQSVVVFISTPGFWHVNHSRRHRVLCLGDMPRDPLPLASLLEHIYGIVAYQNMGFDSPLDRDAARYFLTNPNAMDGLRPVHPLY
jgi:hypothetical protein